MYSKIMNITSSTGRAGQSGRSPMEGYVCQIDKDSLVGRQGENLTRGAPSEQDKQ